MKHKAVIIRALFMEDYPIFANVRVNDLNKGRSFTF